jgi:hypothetical protein
MYWKNSLKINPIEPLLLTQNPALRYFVERDLMNKQVGLIETLWNLPEPQKIIHKQLSDGSWMYPGNPANNRLGTNYFLLETFRNLRILVEKYGFNQAHPNLQKAAEYIYSCQTKEGDIRGILSNQYMPYYMGAILALVIKVGYSKDERTLKGLEWLLSMRQEDGGWFIPLQSYKITYFNEVAQKDPIPPDRGRPFSHMATGMVLRAFAEHTQYRHRLEIIKAGELLKSRLFKKDAYTGHGDVKFWTRFQFPFWWTDLLSSMDLLQKLSFKHTDPDIKRGIEWFIQNQGQNGLWKASYEKRPEMDLWISLAVSRVLNKFLEE